MDEGEIRSGKHEGVVRCDEVRLLKVMWGEGEVKVIC